jgi:alginate O-acetyltransferase complex protein AlgI
MLTSWSYALLLLLVFPLHWASPPALRGWLLLAASAAFYGFADPDGLPVFVALGVLVALIAHRVLAEARTSRAWLSFGVGSLVLVLILVKYRGMVLGPPAVGGAAEALLSPPLGVSYFVFLFIHYLVEVHRGRFGLGRPRDLALFAGFFPTVVAGPIKRFDEFAPQVSRPSLSGDDVHEGMGRIVVGLVKKLVVADNAARFAGPVFAAPQAEWGELWLAVYAYSIQIYFDFSGYSDIAIGSARLLGYRVPENFDYPYLRSNIADFWRHWHMTLTGWILQYVYIPLGGNRRGPVRSNANRLAAMTLCGVWHGPSWNFAAWGLYHGILLNGYHAWRRRRPASSGSLSSRALSTVLTFHAVAIGWVLFACDLRTAGRVLGRLFLVSP